MKRKHKRKRSHVALIWILLVVCACLLLMMLTAPGKESQSTPTSTPQPSATPLPSLPHPTETPKSSATPIPTATPMPDPTAHTLLISAAGDCTLGGDMNGSSEQAFSDQISADADPLTYCFRNVAPIFEADDITIVNLEVVLTESSKHSQAPDKIFIMRGKPEYANMLPAASIEVANIANNHLTDFGQAGIDETVEHLNDAGVGVCGYGYVYQTIVNDINVGFAGFNTWTTADETIVSTIRSLKETCDVVIASFHWGTELEYNATEKQIRYGHMAVDCGADLVLGHHPHVLGGIEVYKGVNIVYSLGNFCFGGKRNPTDKDTFIYQHLFTIDPEGNLTGEGNVIPCKITSVPDESYNNYQPTPVSDSEEAEKILKKIERYSAGFDVMFQVGEP